MDMQIPLYRAKKLNSDEYVEGYLVIDPDRGRDYYYILQNTYMPSVEISKSTLAIHFPDMIDSEGNKIFASLSESGKGGDICYHPTVSNEDLNGVVAYNRCRFSINNGLTPKWSRLVVEGIKK